jgi:hypothetical protein
MIKTAPGANSKMSTIELVQNWQNQKTKEHEYQAQLKEKAHAQARPEIEKILIKKYKDEEIAKATTPKSNQLKEGLKNGLGLDADKMFSDERMDRMVGRTSTNGVNSSVGSSDKIFSKDKLKDMTGNGINQKNLHNAASSNINWDKGVKKSLKSDTNYDGVHRALYADKDKSLNVKKKILR